MDPRQIKIVNGKYDFDLLNDLELEGLKLEVQYVETHPEFYVAILLELGNRRPELLKRIEAVEDDITASLRRQRDKMLAAWRRR